MKKRKLIKEYRDKVKERFMRKHANTQLQWKIVNKLHVLSDAVLCIGIWSFIKRYIEKRSLADISQNKCLQLSVYSEYWG